MNLHSRAQKPSRSLSRASNGLAVRCVNLQAALNLLHSGAPLTSPEIGQRLGVHASTVARLMGTLEAAGLVISATDGSTNSSIGRPPKVWQVNGAAGYAVGLAIHPLVLRGAMVDLAGQPVARRTFSYDPPLTPRVLPGAIEDVVSSLLGHVPRERVLGLGVAVSGIVDPSSGIIRLSGGLLTEEGRPTTDYPLRQELERLFPWPVQVANDANVGALAVFREMVRQGQVAADGSLLYLMAAQNLWGFGGGVVLAGNLYTGARGAAGELLHPRLLTEPPAWGDLPRRAMLGEGEAIQGVLAHLRPVVEHFAGLALTLDTEFVVLGGALPALGSPLLEMMAKLIKTTPGYGQHVADLPTRALLFDPLRPDTLALGAAQLVLDDLFRKPDVGNPGPLVEMALAAVA